MSCAISKDNLFDCANIGDRGLIQEVILLNWEDLHNATVTVDGTSKRITNIVLPAGGKKGYKYSFPKSSTVQPSTPLRTVDRGVDVFDHSLDMIVQQISQLYREDLAAMRFTPVAAIIGRKDGVYELYGRGVGMKMNTLEYLPGDSNMAGTMHVVLQTPSDEPGEISLPIEIFTTDIATTKTLIDSLLVATV